MPISSECAESGRTGLCGYASQREGDYNTLTKPSHEERDVEEGEGEGGYRAVGCWG